MSEGLRGPHGPAGLPLSRALPVTGPADVHRRLQAIGARVAAPSTFAAQASRGWAEWAEPLPADLADLLNRAGSVAVGCDRTLLAGDFGTMADAMGDRCAALRVWLSELGPYPPAAGAPPPIHCGDHRLHFGHKTYIVAILNRTPDSFSDGTGALPDVAEVVAFAWNAYRAGADIVDIGAESSEERDRGGLPPAVERQRLIPVLEVLRDLPVPISIDCRHAEVARVALSIRPMIINDVDALAEGALRRLAAEAGTPVVLMHAATVPAEGDPVDVVGRRLASAVTLAVEAGVGRDQIVLDAGFGFGTTVEQDLEVTRRLRALGALGRPILHAPSRKRAIGRVLAFPETIPERLPGTAAAVAVGIAAGADLVRVHDVSAMARVARMTDALVRAAAWRDIVAP